MVVRYIVRSVISQLPYSQHLPSMLTTHENAKLDDDTLVEDLEPTTPTSGAKKQAMSPKERIHSRMMSRRTDGTLIDYSDTCDDFDAGSSPISQIKYQTRSQPRVRYIDLIPEEDETEAEVSVKERVREYEARGKGLGIDMGAGPENRVQQYLDEQNEKFDHLITKNLDVVIQQQSKYEELSDDELPGLVVDLVRDNRPLSHKVRTGARLVTFVAKKAWGQYSPFKKEEKKEVVEDETDDLDDVLEVLDDKRKARLFQALYKHLAQLPEDELKQLLHDDEDLSLAFHRLNDKPKHTIDKFEMVVVLLVKLMFLGFKLTAPMVRYLHHKFTNNEIVLFNNHNFDKLLLMTIRTMSYVEAKLKNEWEEPPENVLQKTNPPFSCSKETRPFAHNGLSDLMRSTYFDAPDSDHDLLVFHIAERFVDEF